MTRRLFPRILLVSLSLGIPSCKAPGNTGDAQFRAWIADPHHRVYHGSVPTRRNPDKLRAEAAKGEWVMFQVACKSPQDMTDLKVEVSDLNGPTGFIPKYEDLALLFKEHLKQEYTRDDYIQQFTIRIPELLAKLDRIEKIYREQVADTPQVLFDTFTEVRQRLQSAQQKQGDYISPLDL